MAAPCTRGGLRRKTCAPGPKMRVRQLRTENEGAKVHPSAARTGGLASPSTGHALTRPSVTADSRRNHVSNLDSPPPRPRTAAWRENVVTPSTTTAGHRATKTTRKFGCKCSSARRRRDTAPASSFALLLTAFTISASAGPRTLPSARTKHPRFARVFASTAPGRADQNRACERSCPRRSFPPVM